MSLLRTLFCLNACCFPLFVQIHSIDIKAKALLWTSPFPVHRSHSSPKANKVLPKCENMTQTITCCVLHVRNFGQCLEFIWESSLVASAIYLGQPIRAEIPHDVKSEPKSTTQEQTVSREFRLLGIRRESKTRKSVQSANFSDKEQAGIKVR